VLYDIINIIQRATLAHMHHRGIIQFMNYTNITVGKCAQKKKTHDDTHTHTHTHTHKSLKKMENLSQSTLNSTGLGGPETISTSKLDISTLVGSISETESVKNGSELMNLSDFSDAVQILKQSEQHALKSISTGYLTNPSNPTTKRHSG
jgi:hypothetical protein